MSRKICAVLLGSSLLLSTATAWSQTSPLPKLTREELNGAAGDATNHFGDAPDRPAPLATNLDPSLKIGAIKEIMKKVADWQLARAEPYFDQQWTFGALYCGFLSATQTTGDLRYRDAMIAMGEQFKWDLQGRGSPTAAAAAAAAAADNGAGPVDDQGNPIPPPDAATIASMRTTFPLNANSECLTQTYLELNVKLDNPWIIAPSRAALDDQFKIETYPLRNPGRGGAGGGGGGGGFGAGGGGGGAGGGGNAPAGRGRGRGGPTSQPMDGTSAIANPHHLIWWWCDALFMAPPAYARMYTATGERKYLDYIDHHWWLTSQYLYDTDEHLFYRDASFIGKKEKNGQKVFWSRGEGWVMGGLARILQEMPKDYPSRPKFEQQFKEMAAKIASLQGPDGLWRAGMLDPDSYVLPENSGSSFFTYALAWGVNSGLLDSATYQPVVAKAWAGLVSHIHTDGRLDCIQQTGSGPAHFKPSASYVYGVGAFLMAGREVDRMAIAMMMQHK